MATPQATVHIAPFKVSGRIAGTGFILEFVGTNSEGERLEIELEFPTWWSGILSGCIASLKQQGAGKT